MLIATSAGVDWQLNAEATQEDASPAPPEHMRMRFPQGLEHDWRWREWLEGILGREFRGIAPGETTVTLYVCDAPELLFDSLVNLATGSRFLFFGEE